MILILDGHHNKSFKFLLNNGNERSTLIYLVSFHGRKKLKSKLDGIIRLMAQNIEIPYL